MIIAKLPSAPRLLVRAALLLFFSTGAFRAQTVPPPRADVAAEEPLVLSPFQVNVTQDTEYLATESLGGTRFNSSLRDLPAQVSVMTPEFLEDIAVTTLEDSLRYSLNVESAFDAMDVTNPATAGQELGNNPLSGGRTRGMGRSNRSHDFFGTNLPLDTYNTERFTFSSGPNAILFGNSSPTGTIDTTGGRDGFALRVVLWRIHRDKHRQREIIGAVDNGDALRG
jgi:outer membrane receptor for ferric coprogen and ferric-rhodotorulic acid